MPKQLVTLQEKLSLQDKLITRQELALDAKNEAINAKEDALDLYKNFILQSPLFQRNMRTMPVLCLVLLVLCQRELKARCDHGKDYSPCG